jgi:hypothetical protein
MKRSGFKRKIKKTSKVTKSLKKKSKQPISLIQRKLWEQCKRIIRLLYPNTCYTCGATGLEGSNFQTGHMWAKASLGAYLKYDLRVLRPQCMRCNLHQGGRGADFYKKMLDEIGTEEMEKLQDDRNITVKAYDHYVSLLETYKKLEPF